MDAERLEILSTVDLSSYRLLPTGAVLDPNGQQLYLLDYGDNALLTIDLIGGRVTGHIRGLAYEPVALAYASPPPTTANACRGDCDGNGAVFVGELIRAVQAALDGNVPADCASIDSDGDGRVTVSDLVLAVNTALFGCEPH